MESSGQIAEDQVLDRSSNFAQGKTQLRLLPGDVRHQIVGGTNGLRGLSDGGIALIPEAKGLIGRRELAIEAYDDSGNVRNVWGKACQNDAVARFGMLYN